MIKEQECASPCFDQMPVIPEFQNEKWPELWVRGLEGRPGFGRVTFFDVETKIIRRIGEMVQEVVVHHFLKVEKI